MNLLQNLMDRLRALVGSKGWDFCILWKLSGDHRFLEWLDCCCAGTENTQNGGEESNLFPVPIIHPCRDIMFSHPRTKSCDLLAQQPSDIPLDSGIHAESLISNQSKWLNFSNSSDSDIIVEVGTRVLIPVPGGLFELFVAKQVSEDQNVIDFVATQCNISFEQEAMMMNSSNMENTNLPFEISVDRISLCNSPMNILQQFHYNIDNKSKNNMFNETSHEQFKSTESGILDMSNGMHMEFMEPLVNKELKQGNEKDSMKHETGRSESVSDCSDQVDDDDNQTYGRRNGKEPQSKNLEAERKRRKKLNDRLYALRALVPKISKLDRASILGDAIEYVKELQKQAKELQDKLEEHSDDEDDKNTATNLHSSEILNQNGIPSCPIDKTLNGFHIVTSASEPSVHNHDSVITTEKTQQMEPQVEVAQLGSNEFFVKVCCEHKAGGFVRLIEALNSLGLEVSNANVTSFRTLVSNVFSVKNRDSEMIQADNLRDSLLELTRNPASRVHEMVENRSGGDHHHHIHHHNHHLMNSHHHHF